MVPRAGRNRSRVAIRGDDSGRVASVRPTASNVAIARVAVLLLLALAAARPRAPTPRARAGSPPRAGPCVRPGRRSRSRARPRASRARSAPRSRPAARSSSASRARRPASTRPTSSTCARAGAPARSPTTRAAASARRCSTASRSAPAASAPGRPAAGRTSSTSTTSAGRSRETGQIPVPNFPAGLAYGKTPKGDRIYVANNLGGVAGTTNPPGRTVTVIDPKTNHVVKTIDLGLALQPYGVAFGRGRPQGLRDELDGPLGVGDRHPHGARHAADPALAADQPAARRPPERDRRQPAPQRGLHRQRQLRHGLGDRHASAIA